MNSTIAIFLASVVLVAFASAGTAGGFPPPLEDPFASQSSDEAAEAPDDADAQGDAASKPAADAQPDEQNSTIPIDLGDPKRIEAGKERFHSTCADFCHGHEPALFIGRPVDPHSAFDTIREGGKGATPMPPWGDVFSPEEIWELVAYLEHLGKSPAK